MDKERNLPWVYTCLAWIRIQVENKIKQVIKEEY
jgi:hypothetical protein